MVHNVPISLCMAMFLLHPVGYQAFFYSWFWFIPMIIHMLPFRNPFLEALGATFIAHAIGSVLVLYMKTMTAAAWLALIPVVVIERLLFASGMTVIYYGATAVKGILGRYEPCPFTKQIKA